jgi:hypothetical protein
MLTTFFSFALTPLPPAYYAHAIFSSTDGTGPGGLIFALATGVYLWKGQWRSAQFEHWLILSLIVGAAGHMY